MNVITAALGAATKLGPYLELGVFPKTPPTNSSSAKMESRENTVFVTSYS